MGAGKSCLGGCNSSFVLSGGIGLSSRHRVKFVLDLLVLELGVAVSVAEISVSEWVISIIDTVVCLVTWFGMRDWGNLGIAV